MQAYIATCVLFQRLGNRMFFLLWFMLNLAIIEKKKMVAYLKGISVLILLTMY